MNQLTDAELTQGLQTVLPAIRCIVEMREGRGWPNDIRLSFGCLDFWMTLDLGPYEGKEAPVLYGAETVGVARVSGGVIQVILAPPMIGRPVELTCNLLSD
ncbi:MAG: hypothetical protein ABIG68_05220 [Acidobacteriota bacterium]